MRRVLSVLLIALSTAFLPLLNAQPAETDAMLSELSGIRLDKTQIYNIRDITIRRDVFAITFTRGTIAFIQPVNGKVTGAVFIGSGDIVAIPPDAVEKQQLFRFTSSPLLTEGFDTAFFRFTDETYEEIIREYRDRAVEDVTPDEREQFLPFEQELGIGEGTLNYRIVSDFLSANTHPLFWGQLRNDKYGWFSVQYDQRLAEEVAITKTFEANNELGGVWASFNQRAESRDREAAAAESKFAVDVRGYEIESSIDGDNLMAKATVRFAPQWDGERIVHFWISPQASISEVTSASGESLPFHQREGLTEQEAIRLGRNHFIVVLPAPMQRGNEVSLTISYSGALLGQPENDIAYVGDRGLWYPLSERNDRADYDLIFHYSSTLDLIASGVKVSEIEEAGQKRAVWRLANGLIPGFAAGDFEFHSDASGALSAQAILSKNPSVVFRDTDPFRPPPPAPQPAPPPVPAGPRRNRTRDLPPPAIVIPPPVNYGVDLSGFGDAMIREVKATMTALERILGPYPFETLSVMPMTVDFRDGAASLVLLRSISFLDSSQRESLRVPSAEFARAERARAKELAHQWLGQSVGWKSYRDQWLIEGLASYAAVLSLESKYGTERLVEELKLSRAALQEDRGPVWIGNRLATIDNPQGHLSHLEHKGVWIFHMLRMQMGDDAFYQSIREFVQEFKNRDATTFDFKRIVEKYMPSEMDIAGDRKLDWFFDAWIFGSGIPVYAIQSAINQQGADFAITGKITQSEAPADFMMRVPVYGDAALLGFVTVTADEGEFRFTVAARPNRVHLDADSAVLATIRN